MSRSDIECPGDVLSYNCSIQSNSETVHLVWRVTIPDTMPVNVTYDSTSTTSELYVLNDHISTTLRDFVDNEYIESILYLTIVADVPLNETKLECFIGTIGNDTVYVTVNTSGNKQSHTFSSTLVCVF